MAAIDILRQMGNGAGDNAAEVQASLDQLDAKILEINEQIDAIENGLLAEAEASLRDYLENTKVAELAQLDADHVYYGPAFGTINYTTGGITNFAIIDTTGTSIYHYNGINWDGDTTISTYITDYAFGNDYLTRTAITGATYGLYEARDNLIYAKSILEDNRDKLIDSEDVFGRYT